MAGRGREAFPEGRKSRAGFGGPPGGPGEVKRPSWKAKRSREALQEGWKGLGGPPRGLAVVGRPFWRAGRVRRGQEALPEYQEGSGGHPGKRPESNPEGR